MEQPFYHDDSYAAAGYGRTPGGISLHDYKLLKPSLALNLADPYRNLKAPGARGPGPEGNGGGSYFSSQGSDTGASLKLASSELERLIVPNSNGVITTTPTPPGQYFYPRGGGSGGGAGGAGGGVTEEQEGFADGFVKALDDLHKMNHVTPPNVSLGAPNCLSHGESGGGGAEALPIPSPATCLGTAECTPMQFEKKTHLRTFKGSKNDEACAGVNCRSLFQRQLHS